MATSAADDVRTTVTVRDLLDAGLHFGHQTKRWNPKMKKYIFDKRNGIHIIDLTKSLDCLQKALEFIYQTSVSGKAVLFVGTKKQAQQVIKEAAQSCGQPFVVQRWLGGTLTNNVTIRRSIKRMREIEQLEQSGAMAQMHKKEASAMRHELDKLHRNLSGIADMAEMPGAVFIVDILREAIAVQEAKKLNIPVVAIVDTNCDPDSVNYVIPGNDDAIRGIKLVACAIAEAAKRGTGEYAKVAADLAKRRDADRAADEARRVAARAEAKVRKSAEGEKPADGDGEKTARKAGSAGARGPRASATRKIAKPAEAPTEPAVPAAAPVATTTETPSAS
jgi:small subunit ribosomal protein S2